MKPNQTSNIKKINFRNSMEVVEIWNISTHGVHRRTRVDWIVYQTNIYLIRGWLVGKNVQKVHIYKNAVSRAAKLNHVKFNVFSSTSMPHYHTAVYKSLVILAQNAREFRLWPAKTWWIWEHIFSLYIHTHIYID